MKKILFLMLFLLVLGAANVSAQVRIGGNEIPNEAAVLDLNANDDTNTGTKGLALPRVSLNSDDAKLDGVTDNLDGMLVYNTGGSLSAGVYYWNGSNWIMGLTDTIPGGGLTKTGDGNVGIKTGGVVTEMIMDGAVTAEKLQKKIYRWAFTATGTFNIGSAASYNFMTASTPDWVKNCDLSNSWLVPNNQASAVGFQLNVGSVTITRNYTSGNPTFSLFCYF